MTQKYSVLMSLYIKEKGNYLDKALQSMVNQTILPDEIVIVKDGPITDELQKVLDLYTNKYPDLFTIVGFPENKGLGKALNYGLLHTRNEIIVRMDTDDVSKLDRCEKQLRYLEAYPNVDIVGGQIQEFIGEEKNIVGKRIVPLDDFELKQYMKRRCPFNHMTVMFKKSAVLESGNYQDWFWNEDYYLWLRMALQNQIFANMEDILVNVRVGNDMYKRRGGRKYFFSEKRLQKYMLENHIIGLPRYMINILLRVVLQVILPSRVRGVVFKIFARS